MRGRKHCKGQQLPQKGSGLAHLSSRGNKKLMVSWGSGVQDSRGLRVQDGWVAGAGVSPHTVGLGQLWLCTGIRCWGGWCLTLCCCAKELAALCQIVATSCAPSCHQQQPAQPGYLCDFLIASSLTLFVKKLRGCPPFNDL